MPVPRFCRVGLALLAVAALGFVAPAPVAAAEADGAVTYAKDIAPILERSCQNCHRPESVAPMSLLSYEDARPWARAMKYRTGRIGKPDVMPPWYIERDIGIQEYKGDISLTDEEIGKIAAWADNGAPRGEAAEAASEETVADASNWQLGQPDLILKSPSVEVASTAPDWWGPMGEVETGLTEDRYVASIEMREVSDFEGVPERDTIGGLYVIHHLVIVPVGPEGTPDPNDGFWPVHEVGRNPDGSTPSPASCSAPARRSSSRPRICTRTAATRAPTSRSA